MLEDKIRISGADFRIMPYTEKRRAALDAVNTEIAAYIAEDPTKSWDDVPRKVKAEWWRRKADVLLDPVADPFGGDKAAWFASDEFEHTLLGKVEDFFMISRVRL
jgi:hypothetical protein